MRQSIFIFLVLLTACTDDDIKVHRVAKEEFALPKVTSSKLNWQTPASWVENKPEGLRSASFIVKDHTDKQADVSAIFLSGMAGGVLPNVNRWRDQIGLPPWSQNEFETNYIKKPLPIGDSLLVDFTGQDNQRIVTAIVPYESGTWFFKIMGDQAIIEANHSSFIQWLNSVSVGE